MCVRVFGVCVCETCKDVSQFACNPAGPTYSRPLPPSLEHALSIEIELYCSFLEQRRAKAVADTAFCLLRKLLSPSCFPLWEFSIVWQFTFYLFAFLFARSVRVCV